MARSVGKLAWHVHHGGLFEQLTQPIEVRRRYIRENKPSHEIATRLRLLKLVRGPLPAWLAKADAARAKVDAAWEKAYAAWNKASVAWNKASAASMPAMVKLHARECPNCPWNGRTIFPKESR